MSQCRLTEEFFEAYVTACLCLRPDMRAHIKAWAHVRPPPRSARCPDGNAAGQWACGIVCVRVCPLLAPRVDAWHAALERFARSVQKSILLVAELWPGPREVFALALHLLFWAGHTASAGQLYKCCGAVAALARVLCATGRPADFNGAPKFAADSGAVWYSHDPAPRTGVVQRSEGVDAPAAAADAAVREGGDAEEAGAHEAAPAVVAAPARGGRSTTIVAPVRAMIASRVVRCAP